VAASELDFIEDEMVVVVLKRLGTSGSNIAKVAASATPKFNNHLSSPVVALPAASPSTLLGPLMATRQWQPDTRAGTSRLSLAGEGSLLGWTRNTTAEDMPAHQSYKAAQTGL
jgi:hypothetical protein